MAIEIQANQPSAQNNDKQASDTETGLSLIYDEQLPEFLKQSMSLTAAQTAHAKELDAIEYPLDRAALGAEEWNLWVMAHLDRWLTQEKRDDHIFIQTAKYDDETLHEIDFGLGQPKEEDARTFHISQSDFSGFLFPCDVKFWNATFTNPVCFDGAVFAGSCQFIEAAFHQQASFKGTNFGNGGEFHQARFHQEASFNDATFVRHAYFYEAHFNKAATFNQVQFKKGGEFDGAAFAARASFDHTFSNERVTFDGVTGLDFTAFENRNPISSSQ